MRKPFRQLGPAWGKCAQTVLCLLPAAAIGHAQSFSGRLVLADDAGDFVVAELPVGFY